MSNYNRVTAGIEDVIHGLELIAENGKFHEKQTALEAVREIGFFKNYPDNSSPYGEGFCRRLENLEEKLEEELEDESENSTMATPGANDGGGYGAES